MTAFGRACVVALFATCSSPCTQAATDSRVLDDFSAPSAWKALASDQVSSALRPTQGIDGGALCLVYDFNGVSGYAAMRRELPVKYPKNYQFDFKLRGSGPPNAFEFKLIDASGDNVWWVSKPNTTLPSDWTPVRYKRRHISPAWGPLADKTLRNTQFVEFTVSANTGGKGELCVEDLRFGERPLPPDVWPRPRLRATSGRVPESLFDAVTPDVGTAQSVWHSNPASARQPAISADFTLAREFGGLVLHWLPNEFARRYDIELSDDGKHWRTVRSVHEGNGGDDYLRLPESEARYLRLSMRDGPQAQYGLAGIEVKDLAFGASANALIQAMAKQAPKGEFPRGFSGEQTYWTLVGIDGGHASGLIGEDGAIEVARGGFSIAPFVIDGERSCVDDDASCSSRREQSQRMKAIGNWATVSIEQSLRDGYLPMPSVHWTRASGEGMSSSRSPQQDAIDAEGNGARASVNAWRLTIDAFAQGTPDSSRLFARYTLINDGDSARTLTLALAIEPFQVNPPVQFLTTPGGVSEIREIGLDGTSVNVNGAPRVWTLESPTRFFATPFDADMAARHLSVGELPQAQQVMDETGLASAALLYRVELAPHAARTITLVVPLSGNPLAPHLPADASSAWVEAQRDVVAAEWREKLNHVTLKVPAGAQRIADTLRTALAHILISRDGVQIRPGTRSYARSWIRDGAMSSEALLRMGHADEARDFLRWYAPFQFANGKVPCCVDARGADPVPENDSHGELIFLATETVRYTHDRELAEVMWPYVDKAARYMDELRATQRSAVNRGTEKYGLLPASISHEGYSAKPAYSHWDNFWGLTGYRGAIALAEMLGHRDAGRHFTGSRDEFRADILASLKVSAKKFGIDHIPGAADLGDFDATSTTIALSPGGELANLPPDLLRNTFERYWREFVQRRDGQREWKDYTPYEWRNVAVFIRLGWRERAHEAISFFFADRRPAGWNQWAEVVGRDSREPRFVGDMPHGWVASDFIRSVLDLFAYERESDRSMVIAAGIAPAWLEGEGVVIDGLQTPYGALGYSLKREGDTVRLSLRGDSTRMPPGGYVLIWPFDQAPGRTRINGKISQWRGGELRIQRASATVITDL